MVKKQTVSFKLNGADVVDVVVEPRELLIHTLRERLQHTGPHIGCETSHCGACTVDLNGMSVKSCTVLTVQCQDAEVLTVEGFEKGGALHAVQEGFTQGAWSAMRFLHARDDHARLPAAQGKSQSLGGGNPLLDGRQPVPLHGLSEHRQGRAVRGEQDCRWHAPEPNLRGVFAMTATTESLERETKLQGMGSSRLRKEDARFIRGKGTYVDDIKLPGMLFGAMVRSPYAHARIKSINKAKALAVPGVVAVLSRR